ncbi:MAG TPA: hypothetical protein VF060_19145 [Trebonia sp.]
MNLVGAANGQQNYTWPLARSSASDASESHQGISNVTPQPGGTMAASRFMRSAAQMADGLKPSGRHGSPHAD